MTPFFANTPRATRQLALGGGYRKSPQIQHKTPQVGSLQQEPIFYTEHYRNENWHERLSAPKSYAKVLLRGFVHEAQDVNRGYARKTGYIDNACLPSPKKWSTRVKSLLLSCASCPVCCIFDYGIQYKQLNLKCSLTPNG
jgi:hypothetical protein